MRWFWRGLAAWRRLTDWTEFNGIHKGAAENFAVDFPRTATHNLKPHELGFGADSESASDFHPGHGPGFGLGADI
jgi:hypothetical protein